MKLQGYEAKAAAIMKRLARTLHRQGRQSIRRSVHVEERRRQRRPVTKALEDAASAQDESFYRDDREGTVIVAGSRGRIHVFSSEGRHVTSFSLHKDEIDPMFDLVAKLGNRFTICD